MPEATGHIALVERKRGARWYLRYRHPSGKQIQKALGPAWTEKSGRPPAGYYTRKTAQAELDAILTDIRRGEIPDPANKSGRTFGDAVAEWLRYVAHDKARRPSTVRDYRNAANGSLLPEFGEETPLDEIDAERIEAYRRQLLDGNCGRRTAQKYMVLLHGVLKRAKALRWISENPAEQVEKIAVRRSGEFNVLTVSQVEAVAREARGMFSAAILVAAFTGLRAGELRALRWRDISFERSAIRVARNHPVGGEEDAPKSGSVRSVPLMDHAAAALDGLSRRARFTDPDSLVFCDEAGEKLTEDALRHALYEAMEAAGIDRKAFPARKGFVQHDLRHTFGTLAAQVWPLHDVQAFMGHAHIATTMIYAHHIPRTDAAAKLTEFVNRERGNLYPNLYPTAENSEEVSASRPLTQARRELSATPIP